jgi:hypothetical protein
LGVPYRDETGKIFHLSGRLLSKGWWKRLVDSLKWSTANQDQVGEIEYTNGIKWAITVAERVDTQYHPQILHQNRVAGIVIGSHGLIANYRTIPHIPFTGIQPQDAYDNFQNEANQRYLGQVNRDSSLIYQIKEALAAWAAIGEGNTVLQPNPSQKEGLRLFR